MFSCESGLGLEEFGSKFVVYRWRRWELVSPRSRSKGHCERCVRDVSWRDGERERMREKESKAGPEGSAAVMRGDHEAKGGAAMRRDHEGRARPAMGCEGWP